ATGGAGVVAAIGAGASAAYLAKLVTASWRSRRAKRARSVRDEIDRLAEMGAIPQEADPERERFDDAVIEIIRRALDCVDPVVIPAMGRLLELKGRAPGDPFFRAVARIPQDVSAEEYEELRTLAGAMQRSLPNVWDPKSGRAFF